MFAVNNSLYVHTHHFANSEVNVFFELLKSSPRQAWFKIPPCVAQIGNWSASRPSWDFLMFICSMVSLHYTSYFFFNFQMFQELGDKGNTRFSIKIDQSCTKCYNVRLLKVLAFPLSRDKLTLLRTSKIRSVDWLGGRVGALWTRYTALAMLRFIISIRLL